MPIDITISSELAEQARERAEGLTVEAYVERLIGEDQRWREYAEEPLAATHPEFDEVRSAVMKGLEQAERGDGEPTTETFAEMPAGYGISSWDSSSSLTRPRQDLCVWPSSLPRVALV